MAVVCSNLGTRGVDARTGLERAALVRAKALSNTTRNREMHADLVSIEGAHLLSQF